MTVEATLSLLGLLLPLLLLVGLLLYFWTTGHRTLPKATMSDTVVLKKWATPPTEYGFYVVIIGGIPTIGGTPYAAAKMSEHSNCVVLGPLPHALHLPINKSSL